MLSKNPEDMSSMINVYLEEPSASIAGLENIVPHIY
jgi:hypothetical protein